MDLVDLVPCGSEVSGFCAAASEAVAQHRGGLYQGPLYSVGACIIINSRGPESKEGQRVTYLKYTST